MARLQILELPEGSGDERPPFVLVIDQCEGVSLDLVEAIESHWKHVGEQIGARGTLIFTETVNIPANDTTAYLRETIDVLNASTEEQVCCAGSTAPNAVGNESCTLPAGHNGRHRDGLTTWPNSDA